jgi:hypothetical protein
MSNLLWASRSLTCLRLPAGALRLAGCQVGVSIAAHLFALRLLNAHPVVSLRSIHLIEAHPGF